MSLLKEQLDEVLKTLTPREAKVLSLRFALKTAILKLLKRSARNLMLPESVSDRLRLRHSENSATRARSKKLKDFLD